MMSKKKEPSHTIHNPQFTTRNLPKLRFPEFRDAGPWEVKRLGEVCDFIDGYAFSSNDFVKSSENSIQVIRITDINNKNRNSDKVYIPRSLIAKLCLEKYLVKKGDLILSMTGAAGFNFFIWNSNQAIINQRTIKIVSKNDENINLLRILEPLIYDKINQFGSGQNNNLSKAILESIKVVFPKFAEQQKIADCLSSLDELIARETKKLDALKAHKQGLMQQLFPREGETTPRLRFPEFRNAGPWEVKRLGEVAEIYQPETISQSQLHENGEYPVYGANGIIGKFHRYNHETAQIAVTCRGSTCGEITFTQPFSWITGNAMVVNVDGNPNVVKPFIYYELVNTDLKYLITGSGQPQITGEIKKHNIYIPAFPEQQKIADCLSSLDELITLETKRLEALKAHKKGLMQQLFPQEVKP
jgi:type I restriction enzyme S subunit